MNAHVELAPTRTALIAVVGCAAGFLSGLFGVGGGILIVPGLVLVAKLDQRLAHGTSLAAVLPIAMASLATYWIHGNVDWAVSLFLVAGALGGIVLGTKLLHVLPQRTLGLAFSLLLVVSAVRLFIPTDADGRGGITVLAAGGLAFVGLAAGILAGLLGVGGGIVMVPAMIVLFGIPPVVAKGSSLAVIIPTAILGTLRNSARRNADIRAATLLGLAGVVSASFGAWLSDNIADDLSNALFAVLLVLVAARLLVDLEKARRLGTTSTGST